MDSELRIFSFGPLSLMFFKICRMVICPVRRTYNHVSTFLLSSTKNACKLPSPATFAIAKFTYLFRTSHRETSISFTKMSDGDKCNHAAVHVTTTLILLASTHSAIFFPLHRLRDCSLGVTAWIPSSISFGSVLLV